VGLNELIPDFPRHIGIMWRFQVNDKKEFLEAVHKHNGRKRIIYSLYNLRTKLVDKLLVDMDSERAYDNARKLHNYCQEQNLKHMIVFSGGGFHFYIFCKPKPEAHQKTLLERAQRYLAKQVGMAIGRSKMDDIDEAVVGDVGRCVGLPGTFNTKRKRWVRSVPISVFERGLKVIHEFCKPNGGEEGKFKLYIYGKELFSFENVKYKHTTVTLPTEAARDYEIRIDDGVLQKSCPPCVISMLVEKGCWQSRFYASLYLKELGYPEQQINEIAKKYFSRFKRSDKFKNNYEQYKRQQGVLRQLFERDDEYFFPNCETLYQKGFCTGKCKFSPIQQHLYHE